jgi:hypothetical protein
MIEKAVKGNFKLRLGLYGPAGCGKTLAALEIASGLGTKIGVVDTENGSSTMYAWDGEKGYRFKLIRLERYSPKDYIDAIEAFEQAGAEVIILDSFSHAWDGVGGALQTAKAIEEKPNIKSPLQAWGQVTPLYNKLLHKVLQNKTHIICTMRAKYPNAKDEQGHIDYKRKVMLPIQKPGVEYEFDLFFAMDRDHKIYVEKTRCSALDGRVTTLPDEGFVNDIRDWLTPSADVDWDWDEASPQPVANILSAFTSKKSSLWLDYYDVENLSIVPDSVPKRLLTLLSNIAKFGKQNGVPNDVVEAGLNRAIEVKRVDFINEINDVDWLRKFMFDYIKEVARDDEPKEEENAAPSAE